MHRDQIEMAGCRNDAAGILRMIARIVLQKQRIEIEQGHKPHLSRNMKEWVRGYERHPVARLQGLPRRYSGATLGRIPY
jgi:hypothetical protein